MSVEDAEIVQEIYYVEPEPCTSRSVEYGNQSVYKKYC